MAFKMKNQSVAKMVKMAGNNRTAMKMKAEEAAAMKMEKSAMKLDQEKSAMKKYSAMKLDKSDAKKAAKAMASGAKAGGAAAAGKKSAMKLDGDPKKEMTKAEKDAAIANAMPAAKTEALSKETMAGMKSYFGGINADPDAVKAKIKELKRLTERSGVSPKNQAKFDADLKAARRIAKARYPQHFR